MRDSIAVEAHATPPSKARMKTTQRLTAIYRSEWYLAVKSEMGGDLFAHLFYSSHNGTKTYLAHAWMASGWAASALNMVSSGYRHTGSEV